MFCFGANPLEFSYKVCNIYSVSINQETTEPIKQSIRSRYLDHVTGYQPIRDLYFLVRSVPGSCNKYYSHAKLLASHHIDQ